MAVRSRPFVLRLIVPGSGPSNLYTVPSGRTAIIRTYCLWAAWASPRSVRLGVRSGAAEAWIASSSALGTGQVLAITSELYLTEGQELVSWQDGAASANSTIYAGGSLLFGLPE